MVKIINYLMGADSETKPTYNPHMWVLSFADLLCQMVVFFVLLFSMTNIRHEEWQEIKESLSQRLDPEREVTQSTPAADISIEKELALDAQDLGYLKNILKDKLLAAELKDQIVLQQMDDRLVISIAGEESFVRGSSQMTQQLDATMRIISDLLHSTHNRIEIHGNADPQPVSGKTFASNWELSLARALSVSRYLYDHGYPYRLSIYGRGDSAYTDLPEGLSAQQRERLSRRIDIIIRADRADPRA